MIEWLLSDWRLLLGSCCLSSLCAIFIGPAVMADMLLQRMKRDVEKRGW